MGRAWLESLASPTCVRQCQVSGQILRLAIFWVNRFMTVAHTSSRVRWRLAIAIFAHLLTRACQRPLRVRGSDRTLTVGA